MNPAAAVAALIQTGLTVADIATHIGVTPSAVYRWRNRTRTPNPHNAAALRTVADNRLATAALGHREYAAAGRAVDLLTTDAQRAAERAELAWLAASIAHTTREPVVSIARQADPFTLCAATLDDQLDALFPIGLAA